MRGSLAAEPPRQVPSLSPFFILADYSKKSQCKTRLDLASKLAELSLLFFHYMFLAEIHTKGYLFYQGDYAAIARVIFHVSLRTLAHWQQHFILFCRSLPYPFLRLWFVIFRTFTPRPKHYANGMAQVQSSLPVSLINYTGTAASTQRMLLTQLRLSCHTV